MGQIYSRAKEVYIWLGPEADDSALAMRFIKKASDVRQIDDLVQDLNFKPDWVAFAALMRRKWFNRRWVVQELHFAHWAVVHCGKESVNWSLFAQAIALFETRSLEVQAMFGNDSFEFGELQGLGASTLVSTTSNFFAYKQNKGLGDSAAALEVLLSKLSMFQVSNPWDTVYAFLSLAHNGSEIKVDYDKPLVHVLAEAFWKAVDGSKSVDMLCRPWAPTNRDILAWNASLKSTEQEQSQRAQTLLPSWIRDTTFSEFAPRSRNVGVQYDRMSAKSFVGQPGQPIYNASNSSTFTTMSDQYNLTKSTDGALWILRLRGFFVDEIRSQGDAIRGPATGAIIPSSWLRLAKWEPGGPKGAPTAFWRTLVASRGLDGQDPPNWYGKACEHAWENSTSGKLDTEWVLSHCRSSMTANFLRRVIQTVWDRQMFRTWKLKLLGLGPSNSRDEMTVKDGDKIFIVKGCSVPVILRKAGQGRYKFIGESYIHGLMGGDARNIAGVQSDVWTPLQIV